MPDKVALQEGFDIVATMAIMLWFPPKSLVGLLNSYFRNITVLCVLPRKEVDNMAKRRANGDVCERCRWQMKRAKRSGSNKEYRDVNSDRYDYVATGEGVKYG